MARVVLLDNFDSFTYNLDHYLRVAGADLVVVRNDTDAEAIEALRPDALVISPGPCGPERAGSSIQAIHRFAERIPILGVCLGHQALAVAFGGSVSRAAVPVHGKVHQIEHDSSGIFRALPNPLAVTRYHSLVVDRVSDDFVVTARLANHPREIMGIRHRTLPLFGVQYHPEALLTEAGHELIRNFIEVIP